MKTQTELVAEYGNQNTIILDQNQWEAALKLARGSYQQRLLHGWQCLSGADLKGKAGKYGGHYSRSRDALLARLKTAGIAIAEITGRNNKRILVIGNK